MTLRWYDSEIISWREREKNKVENWNRDPIIFFEMFDMFPRIVMMKRYRVYKQYNILWCNPFNVMICIVFESFEYLMKVFLLHHFCWTWKLQKKVAVLDLCNQLCQLCDGFIITWHIICYNYTASSKQNYVMFGWWVTWPHPQMTCLHYWTWGRWWQIVALWANHKISLFFS